MARKVEFDISSEEVVGYMLKTKSSIRQTALHFGCSKTLIGNKVKEYNGTLDADLEELKENNKIQSYENVKKRKVENES